jgi:general stress protein 26
MNTVQINETSVTLKELEQDVWKRLEKGAISYKDALHNSVVANVNTHGVNMRTVVLRKAWPPQKQLAFYTDTRSGKWKELDKQNTISWLFYDAENCIQIRLSGDATLHHDDSIAAESWDATTINNRRNYSGRERPSSVVEFPLSGMPAAFETNDPTPEDSLNGRKNFGVVITKVQWMEWLWLNNNGHRRATFTYMEDGSFTANWLIP